MKTGYQLLLFFLLVAGTPRVLLAQDPFFRLVPLQGTTSGFRINAICQDSTKFIWLATNDGIWKNDGLNFIKLKLAPIVTGSNITAIFPLPEGGIVAGTANGKLFTIIDDSVSLKFSRPFEITVPISSIYAERKEEIWFSTSGMGVFRIRNNLVENFTVEDGLGDNYVYCMTTDNSGRLWIGSDGGLSVSSHKKGAIQFRTINTRNGLPDNIIRQISKGPGNSLGIGMEEKGFCAYDFQKDAFIYKEFFENWTSGAVTAMVKLENEFWLGTQKSGIIDFEFQADRRMRKFDSKSGFSGGNVNALLKDHEGNVWVGAGSELYLSPGEKIEFKERINDMNLSTIHAILCDKLENIWFSNDSGVFCYSKYFKNGIRLFVPENKIHPGKPNVISIYEDSFGFIWMGTFDRGVFRYNPATAEWLNFSENSGLINSSVLSIDGYGNEIWFATLGGVSKCVLSDSLFNGDINFTSFNEQQGLGNNFIYKVFIDSKKRIWFATDGKGITCYVNGKFTNYSVAQGLKSKIIYSITEDKNGMIWFSSSGYGIYRFDGKSFGNISVDQGLNDLNVTSLVSDQKGNIIIVHKKGIDVLNPDNFYLLSLGAELGIGTIDPDVNVVDADIKGNVWIGTIKGIIKLKLDQRIGDQKPVLRINNVLCFLNKVDTTITNIFDHNRNHISFEYTTLWFSDPQKISYQYKLEGYIQEWITTRDRFITFPNLRPGEYNFMLRSSVNSSFTNSGVINYQFRIRYPVWQQPWFIFTTLVLVILLLYLVIRFRDQRLKSIERLKKEKIESQYEILKNQVNPHFLFNSFNTLITVIEENQDVAIEYVNKLSDFFRSILTYRDKDLIPVAEEVDLVETYVFLQKKRYGKNFEVNINLPDSVKSDFLIPPLALQILVENCLKHNAISRETKLTVEIFVENTSYLVVRNNINIKYASEASTGIGLQNLKNRYRLIENKEIIISESPDYYIVKLPLIKDKNH